MSNTVDFGSCHVATVRDGEDTATLFFAPAGSVLIHVRNSMRHPGRTWAYALPPDVDLSAFEEWVWSKGVLRSAMYEAATIDVVAPGLIRVVADDDQDVTPEAIASSYRLWTRYVDSEADMSQEEFSAWSVADKVHLMDVLYGVSDEDVCKPHPAHRTPLGLPVAECAIPAPADSGSPHCASTAPGLDEPLPAGWSAKTLAIRANGQADVTNAMKMECVGEFTFSRSEACGKCASEGPSSDCDECNGGQVVEREVTVPWDTCKAIFKRMVEVAPDVVSTTKDDESAMLAWLIDKAELVHQGRGVNHWQIDSLVFDAAGELDMGDKHREIRAAIMASIQKGQVPV